MYLYFDQVNDSWLSFGTIIIGNVVVSLGICIQLFSSISYNGTAFIDKYITTTSYSKNTNIIEISNGKHNKKCN